MRKYRKSKERLQKIEWCRNLRKEGFSIPEISQRVQVAQGSILQYTKDIKITKQQKSEIHKRISARNQEYFDAKYRLKVLKIQYDAEKYWKKFKDNTQFNLFLGLYKVKGLKTTTVKGKRRNHGFASVQSCDMDNIKFAKNWFKKLAPKAKLGLFIYHYPTRREAAEQHWRRIEVDQYYFYEFKQEREGAFDKPFYLIGSGRIQVNSSDLKIKIDYWLQKFEKRCRKLIG